MSAYLWGAVMRAGFEVLNNSLSVQVTDSFSSVALVAKGIFSTPGIATTVSYVAPEGQPVMLALRPTSGLACVIDYSYSGGAHRWRVNSDHSQPTSGEYFIFSSMWKSSDAGFGLQVFRADGVTLAFDAMEKYMRVLKVLQGEGTEDMDLVIPAGKKAAMLFVRPAFLHAIVSYPITSTAGTWYFDIDRYLASYVCGFHGDQCSLKWRAVNSEYLWGVTPAESLDVRNFKYEMMLVDVTNF